MEHGAPVSGTLTCRGCANFRHSTGFFVKNPPKTAPVRHFKSGNNFQLGGAPLLKPHPLGIYLTQPGMR